MDGKLRAKEIDKLRAMKMSRADLSSTFRNGNGHRSIISDAKALDINLDQVFNIISPDREPALPFMLDELNLAMVDTPGRPSSQVLDLDEFNTPEDACASAYLQRLYTIGCQYPRHPLTAYFTQSHLVDRLNEASFTVTQIPEGTVFNPYSQTRVREIEEIEPEIDFTMFLAESWNTVDDTAKLPFYQDTQRDRRKRRVTELGQIPVLKFGFTEDAKAIYKYGCGIQWSFESAFREVRMQLLGTWVMRHAIEDRIWLLEDAIGVLIDFAVDKNRTHDIPQGSDGGKWTWDKLDTYNYTWRVPYLYDCMIAKPAAITKFKRTDWGSNNWTLGHLTMMNSFFNLNYEDMRMNRKVKFLDLPNLYGEDEETNVFTDADYLFFKKSAALGQVYNTGMTHDATETNQGNQSHTRYFTMGTRFYGVHPKAVQKATLK